MLLEFLFLTTVLFILLYRYFTRNFNHWKEKNVPFLKPLPFFGNMIDGILLRQSMGEIFCTLYQKTMEPVVGIFLLDRPCLLVRDPQIVKRILVNDFQYFYDRSVMNNKRDDPIGTHVLFILKNPDWKEVRTKITPIFTSAKMKIMSKLIEDATHDLIDYLDEQTKIKSVVDVKEACLRYTVDVITSTAFGVNANSFKNENSQFCTEAKKIVNWNDISVAFRFRCYFLAHTLVKLFRMKLFHPTSIEFLKGSFLEIMKSRAASKTRRNDLIDILTEMKNDDKSFIEGDVLVAQVIMFFAAGFETSSSVMSFALHELAHHPEIQSKLRNRINEVSGKYGGINYDSVKEMEYLDMCIKEVLRKYPVLAFLERKCNTRYTIPETGTVIDKDTPVFISSLALQYDPLYFPNPEIFDPERFSNTNKHQIENFTYLPFGEGPRNCIGARFGMLTLKVGLAHVLKHFVVDVCAETETNIKFNPNGVVLSPINGITLKLTKI